MMQVATTCEVLKTKPRIHATGIYISSSMRQQSLPTNAMSCNNEPESALLPGLPDDVAKHCLALVPRIHFQSLGSVCKPWRKFLQSKEFHVVRKLAGTVEEWIYVLTTDADTERTHWQVLNSVQGKWQSLPPMPGPMKTGFGYVVIDGKLLVMAGLFEDDSGTAKASANVYMYDSALNRYNILPFYNCIRFDSVEY
jgi:hypothetical protein